jgi:quercetin dioxygenase-like cupin family protein
LSEYKSDVRLACALATDTTSIGQQFTYPDSARDEVKIVKATIPPGKETGWHKHKFPVFAYVVNGNLTVEIKGMAEKHFSGGSSFAEVINTAHNGKNTGDRDVELIVFFIGEKGMPLSTASGKE